MRQTAPSIASVLRRRIITRHYAPGERLPIREELIGEFGTTRQTLQSAVDGLLEDGLIVARGNQGTFVADKPPYQTRYGIVYPFRPPWPIFFRTLHLAALEMAATQEVQFSFYYSHRGGAASSKLLDDAEKHRIAGLIFLYPPGELAGSAMMADASMPKVAFQTMEFPGAVATVTPDRGSFFAQAVQQLRAAGRKRLALLGMPPESYANWLTQLDGKVETRPCWHLRFSPDFLEGARQATHLLLSGSDRPDGLVIADDHLVDAVAAGIRDAGLRVPEDLDVVAHANFPLAAPAPLPFIRVGFDNRKLLHLSFETIRDWRADGKPGPTRLLAAETEADRAAAVSAQVLIPGTLMAEQA